MAEQQGQPPPGGGQEPSEEELRARLEEEIKRVRVQDVLLQTVVTLVNLAGRRLTVAEEKDLEQARMGIDGVRALLPLCPEDQVGPVRPSALAPPPMPRITSPRRTGSTTARTSGPCARSAFGGSSGHVPAARSS